MKVRVFLNGEKYKGQPDMADFTVACDGGYFYCTERGIAVDEVIGDFDSLGYCPNGGVKFSTVKDFTDGEASVERVKDRATEIVFYNFGGNREDHFVGNLSLLIRANAYKIKAKGVTNYCDIYFVDKKINLKNVKGKIISITPFGGKAHILKGKGLKYSLDGVMLNADKTLGISNEATEDEVEIKLKSGKIFVFVVKENI